MKFNDIDITCDEVLALLTYDPATGEFRWRVSQGRMRASALAGCVNDRGYRVIRINGRSCKAHRLAWLMTHGAWPDGEIDHINRNPADNRLVNLRVVTSSMNKHNCGKNRNNTSGYQGVSLHKKKWRAQIAIEGKNKYLGFFATPEEAYAAYLAAKALLRPTAPNA